MPDVVSWIKSDEHFKVDHRARRGVTLVEPDDAVKYGWVDVEDMGTPYILNTEVTIDVVGIMFRDW